MCRFKVPLEKAVRILRDATNEPHRHWDGFRGEWFEPVDYKVSLNECRAYLMDVRDNVERIMAFQDEFGRLPMRREVGMRFDRSHGTRVYTRKNGCQYCRMVQLEHELGLSDVA